MGTLLQDIRYGVRMLLKKPGFTLMAALTLALGIGANSAIFSVVNAVLLRPLPFQEPERLVAVWQTQPTRGQDTVNFTQERFVDYRDQNQAFANIAAYVQWSFNLTGGDQAERLQGAQVSADFFTVLGSQARMGRVFHTGEDVAGNHRVVVISHGLWQRRFNNDPNVIGQTVTIDGQTMTVVGVMPEDFRFPDRDTEVWVPMEISPTNPDPNKGMYNVIARLKPSLTMAQAQAQMDSLAQQLEAKNPEENRGKGINLVPLHRQVVGDSGTPLFIMLGAVGFVLLIACANVANLQLARASARQKEVAIRMALGANRGLLVRQFLTESLLLALLGGGLGLLLALWGVDVLVAISPEGIPRLDEIAVDGRVLGFMFAITMLTGVIFGIAPALQASRPDMNSALKEGGKGAGGGGRQGLRKLLVVSEVALSLVLLIGAGLLVRSFLSLQAVNPGFNPEKALTLPIWLSPLHYKDAQQQARYAEQALDRIRALPGVEAAGAVAFLPFGGG
ncbi:MAG TPA: ABC transporter permease, partial [Blastocatellia bacterium]|nr:ABC transporter permease [Blastocatellia bacterium]